MPYGFMREFTGVPLEITEADQQLTRCGMLQITEYVYTSYNVGRNLTSGEEWQALYLYDSDKELVRVERTLTLEGITRAIIDLAVLGPRNITSRYTYAYDLETRRSILDGSVRRKDIPDVPAGRAARALDARRLVDEVLLGENAQSEHSESDVGEGEAMINLEDLYVDLVDPREIAGLHSYLASKVESGRYILADYLKVLLLEGMIA